MAPAAAGPPNIPPARWDDEQRDCFAEICDAEFRCGYEYTGNCGRLVITALTDRCYVTLTQSLRLVMGGAPTGPAGTGKTETTKDLGHSLGMWVIVTNCSEQMTVRSLANGLSGLAQSGAWVRRNRPSNHRLLMRMGSWIGS